jgi:hypothetical protein
MARVRFARRNALESRTQRVYVRRRVYGGGKFSAECVSPPSNAAVDWRLGVCTVALPKVKRCRRVQTH